MKYRPEIDGLRALAVLPVIFFHTGSNIFSGGFIGVDIFFVISGYLITSIILQDLEQDKFTIRHFYERRTRRILPALFFVMFCCLPFAWYWMTPTQLKDFGQSLFSISVFSSNILFFLQSGYFEHAAELKPLLHTWSLAVEEQYYLIFPILIMLIWRIDTNAIKFILSLLFIISILSAEWGWRHNESANFYLLPMRMWELLAGSLLGLFLHNNQRPIYAAQILSIIGFLALIASLILFNKNVSHPSLITLIPVIATVLIIYAARNETYVGRFLSSKYLVEIGLLSYSAYLWHYPLFAFARIKSKEYIGASTYTVLILATLFLAWLTYKYIETPFRDKNKIKLKYVISLSLISSLLFIGLGLVFYAQNGFSERFGAKEQTIFIQQQSIHQPFLINCSKNTTVKNDDYLLKTCALGAKNQFNIEYIVWGDSHAASLAYGIDNELKRINKSGLLISTFGCPPVTGVTRADNAKMRPKCHTFSQRASSLIHKLNPKYIIISTRWALHLQGKRFNNSEGGIEPGEKVQVKGVQTNGLMYDINVKETYLKYYQELSEELKEQGTKLIFITQVPEAGWNVPERSLFELKSTKENIKTLKSVYDTRNQQTYELFDALQNKENITILDPSELFCDDEFCHHTQDLIPYYSDDDHLSFLGSKKIAKWIFKELE